MKIIMGTDSLHGPLTGVGRYTYELCNRLIHAPDISELEGFDFGRFHTIASRLRKLDEEHQSDRIGNAESTIAKLKLSLSRSRVATNLYQQHATLMCGLILKNRPYTIFHSPNFHLPKYIKKSVVTIHDLSYLLQSEYHPGARVAWMSKLVPKAVEHSSHIICVSESTKADLIDNYQVDADKISVTYLGVDEKFKVRTADSVYPILDSYGLTCGQYFLCVSTLEPRKNIGGLIDAYLRLSKATRMKFPLVLVGGFGWHYERLKLTLRDLISEGVKHLGFVRQHELPFLYNGARCFVYPSFYEGFGLPVLEAQASGIPVIASNTSSIPEVAGEDAILVDPSKKDQLVNALDRALEDENWLERCSLSGLQKAQNFTWDKCAKATIQVYKKVQQDADQLQTPGSRAPSPPLVTVAIPSFNQGQFLDDTLTSIFRQKLPMEVFVLDGGSTDNSLDIIRKWEPQLAGWRSHVDLGQADAINEGIAQGSAPYVCWLNSDDFFYPGGLIKLIRSLKKQPEKQFVYANCWAVMKSGRKFSPYLTLPFSTRLFANFCFIAQPATLVKRNAWEKIRGVNAEMHMAFDYDLWWRLYKEYGDPAFCRSFVAATRMHKDTKTASNTELHYQESIDVVKRNWGSVPVKWRVTFPIIKMIHKLNK